MKTLSFGFYGEGSSDYAFFEPLLLRIVPKYWPDYEPLYYSLAPYETAPTTTPKSKTSLKQEEKMLQVAKAGAYQLIIFHLDADDSTLDNAYRERFSNPLERLKARNDTSLNLDMIPIIPIRMTEAWFFVDFQAFKQAIDEDIPDSEAQGLGFPHKVAEVESIEKPKQTFRQLVSKLRPRLKPQDYPAIYDNLAKRLDLSRLSLTPSYQFFHQEMQKFQEAHPYL